jgi:RecA/RadA recombinase
MDRERPDAGFMVVDGLTGLNRKRVIEFGGNGASLSTERCVRAVLQ